MHQEGENSASHHGCNHGVIFPPAAVHSMELLPSKSTEGCGTSVLQEIMARHKEIMARHKEIMAQPT